MLTTRRKDISKKAEQLKKEVISLSMEKAGINLCTKIKKYIQRGLYVIIIFLSIIYLFTKFISLALVYNITNIFGTDLPLLLDTIESPSSIFFAIISILATIEVFPFSEVDIDSYRRFYDESLLQIINTSQCAEEIKSKMRSIVDESFKIIFEREGKDSCDEKLIKIIQKILEIDGADCLF